MLTGLGWSVVSVPMGNGSAIVNAACQAASGDRKKEEVLFVKLFFCKKKGFGTLPDRAFNIKVQRMAWALCVCLGTDACCV